MTRSDPDAVVDTVSTAALRAMEENGGDIGLAAKALENAVRKDRTLKAALLEPLVQYACYNAVRRQLQVNRDRVWNPPAPRPGMSDADKVALLARSNLMLFALPIANGKLLKDATRAEIGLAQDFYTKQAKDMSHKARWLALVSQSIPDGKTVEQALTEDRLRELQEIARND